MTRPLVQLVNEAKLGRNQLRLIALIIRRTCQSQTLEQKSIWQIAEYWADELRYHCHSFDRDRFINAVLTGED